MGSPEAVAGINRGHGRPHSDPLWSMIVATVIIGISALCRAIMLRRVVVPVVPVVPVIPVISVVATVILPVIMIPVLTVAVATSPCLGFHHRRQSTHANHARCRQTTDNLPQASLLNRVSDLVHQFLLAWKGGECAPHPDDLEFPRVHAIQLRGVGRTGVALLRRHGLAVLGSIRVSPTRRCAPTIAVTDTPGGAAVAGVSGVATADGIRGRAAGWVGEGRFPTAHWRGCRAAAGAGGG